MAGIGKHAQATNIEVVAVSDPWRVAREKAQAKAKEAFGSDAKMCVSYREVLEMKDVDAVMIASPDHLHTLHLEAAAKANKHIYVEKPLATEFDKLVRSYDAAKAAQARGSIIQVGTQLRSIPGVAGARELVKSGLLG
jgi:predicted dehydrogenase